MNPSLCVLSITFDHIRYRAASVVLYIEIPQLKLRGFEGLFVLFLFFATLFVLYCISLQYFVS